MESVRSCRQRCASRQLSRAVPADWPNPSIERTCPSWLRSRLDAAEVSATFVVPGSGGVTLVIRVALSPEEFEAVQTVFNGEPFGPQKHAVHLQGLALGEDASCKLRSCLNGSRRDHWVAICSRTLDGLHYVFNRFARDAKLVPERPMALLEEAPSGELGRSNA